jgi:hypothetical protein
MPKKKASKGLKAVNESAGGSAGNPDIRYTNTFCIDDVYSWDYENELGNETFRKSFEDIFVGESSRRFDTQHSSLQWYD